LKALLSILLSLFLSINLYAQDGSYFLTHYTSGDQNINNVNFDIAQTQRGIICIANRSGIIQFDGKNWDKISTPTAIFSLAIGKDNTIYTGGISGLGSVKNDSKNYLTYTAISDSTVSDIFDLVLHNDKIYGINTSTVFVYDLKSQQVRQIKSTYSGELLKLLLIDDQVFVNTAISGLKAVGAKSLDTPKNSTLDGLKVEFVSARKGTSKYLMGLSNNKVAVLENGSLQTINLESEYLNQSIIIDGLWLADSLIAVATLKGGVVFVNPQSEKITQIVNYRNGLPDNEIFAIALDSHNGLWVSHNEGFTRISPKLPFRAYDRYPGLEGDLLTTTYHNNKLYVGTSLGLYYLAEIKEYDEKTVVKKRVVEVPQKQEEEKERKGLFGFLKRNNEDDRPSPKRVTRYFQQTEKELQSIRYEYKKVANIESKVFNLSTVGQRLFCGGLDGLFEIKDTTAATISQSPIRTFHASTKYQKVFINTYDDRFEVYKLNEGYDKLSLFSDFADWVSYIFEDDKGRVWFCSSNDLYWIKLKGDEIISSGEHFIKNPYFYETFGVDYQDSLYFINEEGTFLLDESTSKIKKIDDQTQKKYLRDNNGTVWIYKDDKWKTLGSNFASSHLNILSVFTDISNISFDEEHQNFWVLTSSGSLFKLNINNDLSHSLTSYDLFLKNIRTTNQIFLPKPGLKFSQENSALTFEFVQPEYSGILNIEYQYMIEGLNEKWSEWSSSYNVIPIPYLPDGKYKLKMRSKNIATGVKEIDPIKFEIIPPYWKRPWFLAFEFSALALLLFLSVRLKKLGYKYRMLSRLLALLTLIIIIEFIQTVAENEFGTETSPVIDFIIQIVVAIIILPVEGVLRKYIFKEKNVQILDFISLKNKK